VFDTLFFYAILRGNRLLVPKKVGKKILGIFCPIGFMIKKLLKKYFNLVKKVDERHYWPLFIFLSCYFVVPYSEYVITLLIVLYFKFEAQFRKWGGRIIKPFPEWIRFGGSTIFFLVMLDDTLAYLSIIAIGIWTNRQLKKEKEREEKLNTDLDVDSE